MTAHSDMHAFFFLYEGATDWSDQGLLMGQQDIPLNDKGREEADEAGKVLVGHEITSLCFSPLTRAKEAAQIIAKHCHCGLYPLEGLKERCWGAWEGQVYNKDLLVADDEELPEGAEKKVHLIARVRSALSSAQTYPATILIVSHAEVLQVICDDLEVSYPTIANNKGILHFFKRLGRWVVNPL